MLTIEDLLYGLMLPSGNDAAIVLSEVIGKIIQKHKKKPSQFPPSKTFIKHMNILYK
jgi:D-alanyl-D-alanine carboxypeptidase